MNLGRVGRLSSPDPSTNLVSVNRGTGCRVFYSLELDRGKNLFFPGLFSFHISSFRKVNGQAYHNWISSLSKLYLAEMIIS
ncbi:hypothetical protein J2Z65_006971 [Paenibacillus aceris]|uniref:Uncharacterized protein n=1 Tax=Paenibacillus aceris TaxID=869555 RepID=A0ABS4I9V6_9BACL|nr:hypothetical protein [Paenibacillus aceris]